MYCNGILKEDIEKVIACKGLFRFFDGNIILITGGTGFIGSMMLRIFAAANDKYKYKIKILCQVRDYKKAEIVLGDVIERNDVEVIISDSFEIDVPCDYIIHTVCPTSSKYFVSYPVETIDVSIYSTKKMLELAKRRKIKKMVYISSMEEYGIPYEKDQIKVMSEDNIGVIDPLAIRSCYPESKRMCECYCSSYSAEYGVNVSIARLAQTFGSGVPLSDNRVFMQFANSAINGKDIVLHTSGESMLNFCYITDAIMGILTVLIKGGSAEAYNVCNDKETRAVVDIAKLVAHKIAEKRLDIVFDLPESELKYGYAPNIKMCLCSDKLRNLGWVPQISMENAYRRLITYIKEEAAKEKKNEAYTIR